jgi:hypothetical protein
MNMVGIYSKLLEFPYPFWRRGLMVRRCFPVAEIVGSSPAGVVSFFAILISLGGCFEVFQIEITFFVNDRAMVC